MPEDRVADHSRCSIAPGGKDSQPQRVDWIAPWALAGVAAVFILTILNKFGFQLARIPDGSGHHQKLLNSVKDWQSFGFFKLGGLLSFTDKDSYTGFLPDKLYGSHAPFYAFPHWLSYAIRGEDGFYFTVVVLTVLLAISMSACLGFLATRMLPEDLVRRSGTTSTCLLAVAISIPGEALWGTGFNNFDCTPAFQAYLIGLTLIACGPWRGAGRLGVGLIVLLTPFLAPRLGVGIVLSLILCRLALRRRDISSLPSALRVLLHKRSIAIAALMSSLHFLHLVVVRALLADQFTLRAGGGWMARMGFVAGTEGMGQGSYDYISTLQTFSFIWRQAEFIQGIQKFPLNVDIEHVLFWGIGIAASLLLLMRLRDLPQQTLLMLMLAPGLILSTFLNQSSSEHPDYYNIFWHPALVLGWTYLMLSFLSRLPRSTQTLDLRAFVSVIIVWSLFLWQIRYFLLAYFPAS